VKPGEEIDAPPGEAEDEEEKWTASVVADFDQHKWVNLCTLLPYGS
jgi:hypothetical protein